MTDPHASQRRKAGVATVLVLAGAVALWIVPQGAPSDAPEASGTQRTRDSREQRRGHNSTSERAGQNSGSEQPGSKPVSVCVKDSRSADQSAPLDAARLRQPNGSWLDVALDERGCAITRAPSRGRLVATLPGAPGAVPLDVFLQGSGPRDFMLEANDPCRVVIEVVHAGAEPASDLEVTLRTGPRHGRSFKALLNSTGGTDAYGLAQFDAPCGLDGKASVFSDPDDGSDAQEGWVSFTITEQLQPQRLELRPVGTTEPSGNDDEVREVRFQPDTIVGLRCITGGRLGAPCAREADVFRCQCQGPLLARAVDWHISWLLGGSSGGTYSPPATTEFCLDSDEVLQADVRPAEAPENPLVAAMGLALGSEEVCIRVPRGAPVRVDSNRIGEGPWVLTPAGATEFVSLPLQGE